MSRPCACVVLSLMLLSGCGTDGGNGSNGGSGGAAGAGGGATGGSSAGGTGGGSGTGGSPAGGAGGVAVTVGWPPERVASGRSQSCVIDRQDHVVCFGPQSAEDGRSDRAYSRVAQSGAETCVLSVDGVIECWGSATNSAPTGAFSRIAAGGLFDCALATDGAVSCWSDSQPSHEAITTLPSERFMAIDAGTYHVCGLLRDSGGILCWGSGLEEQLASPTGSFAQLSVGELHACALRADGTMACWGASHAEAGVARDGNFIQVSVGDGHACAIRAADSSVLCWGGAEVGVELTPPTGAFAEIAVGYRHACGIRPDGAIACWGANLGTVPASL